MAADNALAQAVRRIERVCAAHDEERPMRIAIVDELRRSIGFGSYVWALTDPETQVGSAPLADVPVALLQDLPTLIRLRYLTAINRWSTVGASAQSLHGATNGEMQQSRLHREMLAGAGVGDLATVVFRDVLGLWGWLELWRAADDGPFAELELEHLTAVAPAVTAAIRRCQARTFGQTADVPERPGPVVLMLSPDLHVRAQTPDTDAYLRALLPPDGDGRPIPAGAYNVAAQLLAVEAGVDHHPPTSRMRLRDGVWLTFRAARVETDDPAGERDIAVSIEPASPTERRDLFCRAHGLTPRETELLGLVVEGADTKSVAEALFLSQHTVQDHLKAIFAKTGARNRRTLVSWVSGR